MLQATSPQSYLNSTWSDMDMNYENDTTEPKIISRFSLAILGCLAIGIGIGSQLPFNFGGMAIFGGIVALGFYHYQTRRLVKRYMQQSESCRIAAEERLAQHVTTPSPSRERTPQAV